MELVVKNLSELNVYELFEIMKLRVDVFVVEQNCPYPELDDHDLSARHAYLLDNNEIVAYLRVMFDKGGVRMGRIVSKYRGSGLGKKLVSEVLAMIRETGAKRVDIHAQTYAQGFYEKLGFVKCGEEFLEDDIPHIPMYCEL